MKSLLTVAAWGDVVGDSDRLANDISNGVELLDLFTSLLAGVKTPAGWYSLHGCCDGRRVASQLRSRR